MSAQRGRTSPGLAAALLAAALLAAALGGGARATAADGAAPAQPGFLDEAPRLLGLPVSWRRLPELEAAVGGDATTGRDATELAIELRGYGDPAAGVFAVIAEARCRQACDAMAAVTGLRRALDEAAVAGQLTVEEIDLSGSADGQAGISAALHVAAGPLDGRLRTLAAAQAPAAGPALRAVACLYNAREAETSRLQCEAVLAQLEVVP